MKWILRMVSPPVGSEEKINTCTLITDIDAEFATLTWEAPQIECSCSVLQLPSSPHQRDRSQISIVGEDWIEVIVCVTLNFFFSETDLFPTYIKVLFNAGWSETLWDDHHSSLHVEPQAHLCSGLTVLFGDWLQHFILQQRRAL